MHPAKKPLVFKNIWYTYSSMVTYREDEQNKLLSDLRAQEEEALVQKIANDIGMPYQDLTAVTINSDALRLIDETTARKAEMAGYAMVGKKLDIAVKSPSNPDTMAELNRLEQAGYSTNLYIVSMRSLEKAWGRYRDLSSSEAARGGLLDISDENLQQIAASVHNNSDVKTRLEEIFQSNDSHQVSRIMETVFGSAIALKSSDVHFEPEESFTRVRFREDGVLQEITQIAPPLYQKLLNRAKFISGMKLTNTETAQDGRFTIVYKGMEVEVRVAVAPGAYNESIVLRILNPEGLAVDFEKLGIEPRLFKVLEREIAKPNGLILTTGPTGSGKTTTLYSFLKKIYSPEIKIITIEDPIEYHLEGVTQEQVSHEKGFDFLAGLRAALRQDPDVIMVGEIRDKETATIAINASLTGHMVFSTLHTNNAAGTIPRLLDLGIQPGILAAALTVSIAQRLVRRLCPNCKKEAVLSQDKQEVLRAVMRNGERIGKDFASYNLRSDMELKTYEPVGCDQCGGTGFKGRVGLFEAIITDDVIAKIMAQVPTPTERDIKKAAEHQQIFTMIEDGVIKILTGATSFDEIQTVVDLSEDISSTGSVPPAMATPAQPAAVSTPVPKEVPLESFAPDGRPSGEEVALLVDYLKLLESQQQQTPSVGIADKIARAQHMILSILENTPNLDALFSQKNPSVMVRDEIENLIKELQLLEQDQIKNPSAGIAAQIANIRNNIQNMTREVVK
jgi:type IV pilus assembly protein PilB